MAKKIIKPVDSVNEIQAPLEFPVVFTYLVIAICVTLYIISVISIDYVNELVLWPNNMEIWMIFSSIFLHIDMIHLFLSVLTLYLFGIMLEKIIGSKKFAAIFLISGIFGNVGYYVLAHATDPSISALGTGGAFFGIIGTLAVLRPNNMEWYMYPIKMKYVIIIGPVLSIFGGIAYVAMVCGGLIIGLVAGLMLFHKYKIEEKPKQINKTKTELEPIEINEILDSHSPNEIQMDTPSPNYQPIDQTMPILDKFCPYCGKNNPVDYKFCNYCQKKLP